VKWSYSKTLADSKIVKSSYIWLLIVPISARAFSSLDEIIDFTVFGSTFQLTTSFPFSWQLLFLASCFFTLANIIYSLFCPEIFKENKSYSEFNEHSKTLLQIHDSMKNMVWSNREGAVKPKYTRELSSYFRDFCASPNMDEEQINNSALTLFLTNKQESVPNTPNNAALRRSV